jgi:hypothetical protein
MMDLGLDPPGLGGPGVGVVPVEVGEDRGVLLGMAPMIGAVERERSQRLELALDEVEPARFEYVGRNTNSISWPAIQVCSSAFW